MKTGVQRIYNYLKKLDSGFRRNDRKPHFQTSYEFINLAALKIEFWPVYSESHAPKAYL